MDKADSCSNGSRTHEPSLRELTVELDGVEKVLTEKIEANTKVAVERDRRYEERFKAMDEKTSLALTSSEKAVSKAETATEKRFDSVNEFRATLNDQAGNLMSKSEANAKFQSYEEKFSELRKDIEGLREFRSKGEGNNCWGETKLDSSYRYQCSHFGFSWYCSDISTNITYIKEVRS
jgi:hypothetical protein